jgi:hypothetical protein
VKTTIELPDELFREAKATAARQGRSLRAVVTEALADKLQAGGAPSNAPPPWHRAIGALRHLRDEHRKIERWIEEEFERIEPEDRV